MTIPPLPPQTPDDDPDAHRLDAGNRRLSGIYRILMIVFAVVVSIFLLTQLASWGPGSMLDRLEEPTPAPGPTQRAAPTPGGEPLI